MSDLETYIKCMEEHHCSALKSGETAFAKHIEFCVLTAKGCLKNIKKDGNNE